MTPKFSGMANIPQFKSGLAH
jgi:hypothetical protein